MNLPSNKSLSSLRASRLSLRNCLSISAFIRFCSCCSSDKQQAMLKFFEGSTQLNEYRFFVKLSQRFDKNITHKMLNYLATRFWWMTMTMMDGARGFDKEIAVTLVFQYMLMLDLVFRSHNVFDCCSTDFILFLK